MDPLGLLPYTRPGNLPNFTKAVGNRNHLFHCPFTLKLHRQWELESLRNSSCPILNQRFTIVNRWVTPHCPMDFRLSPELLHLLSSEFFWSYMCYTSVYPMPRKGKWFGVLPFPERPNQKAKSSFLICLRRHYQYLCICKTWSSFDPIDKMVFFPKRNHKPGSKTIKKDSPVH